MLRIRRKRTSRIRPTLTPRKRRRMPKRRRRSPRRRPRMTLLPPRKRPMMTPPKPRLMLKRRRKRLRRRLLRSPKKPRIRPDKRKLQGKVLRNPISRSMMQLNRQSRKLLRLSAR